MKRKIIINPKIIKVIFFISITFILSCSSSDSAVKDDEKRIRIDSSGKESEVIDKLKDKDEKATGPEEKEEEVADEAKAIKEEFKGYGFVPEGGRGSEGLIDVSSSGAKPKFKKKPGGRGKAGGKRRPASPSGLKAGFADDNKQFNYFLNFLDKFKDVKHYKINIRERIILKIKDTRGKPILNAKIKIYSDGKLLRTGTTYADGTFLFFPSEYNEKRYKYRAVVTYMQKKKEVTIDRQDKRKVDITFDLSRQVIKNIPLDILFIFDTTGSMGEEIRRLKKMIEDINLNLTELSIKPRLRFGMVLYKDKRDLYVTKVVHLTGNLDKFQKELNKVKAGGGGDEPEDLQAALKDAIKEIEWNNDGVRLGFIITDAPPHLDYSQDYTYVNASKDAGKKGIKLFTIGTGGLDTMGEYILRQISQYTYSKYIFLTYGEKGESGGGKPGSVSHHTGANFKTDKLETIIIRFAREELSFQTDKPLEAGEEYFEANKIQDEKKEETLKNLFNKCISQLIDYSTFHIKKATPTGVLPFTARESALELNAEYFTEQLIFSLSRNEIFKMVERKDMQKILKELELQMSGLGEEKNLVKVGKFIGAEILIMGKIYVKAGNYEIFLKLLRVETGEILSVTKAKVEKKLGL